MDTQTLFAVAPLATVTWIVLWLAKRMGVPTRFFAFPASNIVAFGLAYLWSIWSGTEIPEVVIQALFAGQGAVWMEEGKDKALQNKRYTKIISPGLWEQLLKKVEKPIEKQPVRPLPKSPQPKVKPRPKPKVPKKPARKGVPKNAG